MSGSVIFNATQFKAAFPEFAGLGAFQLETSFTLGGVYLDNGPTSVVADLTQRAVLFNLITAHMAYLLYGTNDGQGNIVEPSPLVGTVQTAAQGTVNVAVKVEGENQQRAFFSQTKYGLAFWQATATYRTMQYRPGFPGGLSPFSRIPTI